MKLNILSLFPSYFETYLNESIIKKAIQRGIIEINLIDIRDFASPPHFKVDDTIYGGSPGMLLMIEPLVKALESCGGYRILLTPQGKIFDQEKAKELAKIGEITLIAGRYEGFDERITHFIDEEISIGNFILTGGELAALVVADSTLRLLPGVVGNEQSLKQETLHDLPLLDYSQYTKPRVFRDLKVPEVLTSGDHAKISL